MSDTGNNQNDQLSEEQVFGFIKENYDPKEFQKAIHDNLTDHHQAIYSKGYGKAKSDYDKSDEYESKIAELQNQLNSSNSDEVIQNQQEKISSLESKVGELKESQNKKLREYKEDLFKQEVLSKGSEHVDREWLEGVLHNPKYNSRLDYQDDEVIVLDDEGAPIQTDDKSSRFVQLIVDNAPKSALKQQSQSTGLGDTNTNGSAHRYAWSEVKNNRDLHRKWENDEIEVDPSK